jgi:hypothetical protein
MTDRFVAKLLPFSNHNWESIILLIGVQTVSICCFPSKFSLALIGPHWPSLAHAEASPRSKEANPRVMHFMRASPYR